MPNYSNDLPVVQGGGVTIWRSDADDLPDLDLPTPQADWMPDDTSGTSSFFGQQTAGTPARVQDFVNQIAGQFGPAMQRAGVRGEIADAASRWFKTSSRLTRPLPARRHDHADLVQKFEQLDRPFAASFLGAMDAAGATRDEIELMVNWYLGLIRDLKRQTQPAPAAEPEIDFSDAELERQRQRGLDELRTRWGHSFEANLRIVRRYVAGQPAAARDLLETKMTSNGVLAANDPDLIEMIFAEATGANRAPSNLAGEIAEIERVMKTDRRRYNRDELMQARYRELLRIRG